MIVHWPGVTVPHSESENYVIIEDFFPTILEMAGISESKQVGGIIDGKSFVPYLEGKSDLNQTRPIFWHYPNTYDQPPYSSVRVGDWKIVYQHVTQELELYNLKNDISESTNRAKEESEKLSEMSKILSNFLRESKAQFPISKETNNVIVFPDEL
jgi:arylsulfatase A-like enzyme